MQLALAAQHRLCLLCFLQQQQQQQVLLTLVLLLRLACHVCGRQAAARPAQGVSLSMLVLSLLLLHPEHGALLLCLLVPAAAPGTNRACAAGGEQRIAVAFES
jgi:hypothetical protein